MEPGHQAGGSRSWVFRIAWPIVTIICAEEVTSMLKKLLSAQRQENADGVPEIESRSCAFKVG